VQDLRVAPSRKARGLPIVKEEISRYARNDRKGLSPRAQSRGSLGTVGLGKTWMGADPETSAEGSPHEASSRTKWGMPR